MWDFRVSIRFGEMVQRLSGDPDVSFLVSALELYYPGADFRTIDAGKAFERALWFYGCGKTEEEKEKRSAKKSRRLLSYEYDGDYIYAAFRSQYGIDLADMGSFHWWRFRALLEGLKEDEHIVKVMGYRALDAADFAKMSKEDRAHYRKLQKEYALPKHVDPEEKALMDELNAALMGDGNIAGIIATGKE